MIGNYSAAVFLMNKNIRAIKVSYEDDKTGKPIGQLYTFKTLDKTIQVGDLVVVPTGTRHSFTVCKVHEVDVVVDHKGDVTYKWVALKIDLAPYNWAVAEDERAVAAFRKADERRMRDELAQTLAKDYAAEIAELPMAQADAPQIAAVADAAPKTE